MRRYLIATGVCIAVGCQAPEPERVAFDVGSSGEAIVTNRQSVESLASIWEVGEPTLELGNVDGDGPATFSSIHAVSIRPDGSFVVVDGTSREARFFSSEGEPLAVIGGRGEGPGEFGAVPSIAGVSGDSIWLFDSRAQRLTTMRVTGEVLGTATFDVDRDGRVSRLLRRPNGSFVGVSDLVRRGVPFADIPDFTLVRDTSVVRWIDRELVTVDTLGRLPADESYRQRVTQDQGGGMFRVQNSQVGRPFGRTALVTVLGDAVFMASSDEFEWTLADAPGSVMLVSRSPGLQEPVSDEAKERLVDEYLSSTESPDRRRGIESMMEDFPPPALRPAFDQVLAGPSDQVWLRKHRGASSDPNLWFVFEGTGEALGKVEFPIDVEVLAVGASYVLGVRLDGLDVPFLVRLPLVRLE